MNDLTVVGCALLYLSGLFAVADWAERRGRSGRSTVNSPYLYALSMAVYCTAWTYYGSVGRAAKEGLEFAAIFVGPTLAAPLAWPVLRKIIRICKTQRITSIADFLSARYGKRRGLGVLVAVFCVVGVIPYISLQIKAIAVSFALMSGEVSGSMWLADKALYLTLLLALFTILFGARQLEATERHEGLVTAVALESLVKLVAFVAVGVYVTWGLFDGPGDIFGQAASVPHLREEFTFGEGHNSTEWFWYVLISVPAVLFLPRQFQVSVVENVDEQHLEKAMWLFPLYLLLINLFVLPVAFGGELIRGAAPLDADGYVLSLPLQHGQQALALLAFLGGFSAASGMIIVETTALSVMISNNIVMPILVGWPQFATPTTRLGSAGTTVLTIRRFAILGVLLLAYLYYRKVTPHYSLVSVGMISFVAMAQFTPAMLGGLFWKQGNLAGTRLGLWSGMLVWFYTLIVPTLVPVGWLPAELLTNGPGDLSWLRPQALFGLGHLDPVAHATFWSLLLNTSGYVWASLYTRPTPLEQRQAVLFVDVFRYNRTDGQPGVWRGQAQVADLRGLLNTFFGPEQADELLRQGPPATQSPEAGPALVTYTESVLAGAVGSASARMLVGSVTTEEPIDVNEVIGILKSSQALLTANEGLKQQSGELQQLTRQLQEANERLRQADGQKDDFLSTITHEVRTPITSIRALAEILHDNPDMNDHTRTEFLATIVRESERLTRLINQVLDLERIESGRLQLTTEPLLVRDVIRQAIESVQQLIRAKHIALTVQYDCPPTPVWADRDRLMQVVINLLSNAVKFCEADRGHIVIGLSREGNELVLRVTDNGVGIAPAYHELIFDKFYQARSQARDKPNGSGLGLAICRKLVELHGGSIRVDSKEGRGAVFTVRIPY